jgi:hypothetical protein
MAMGGKIRDGTWLAGWLVKTIEATCSKPYF